VTSPWRERAERIRGEIMDLLPERMAPVVEGVPQLWARVQPELLAFAGFLDDLARSASEAS
jgi:hypothetical protein